MSDIAGRVSACRLSREESSNPAPIRGLVTASILLHRRPSSSSSSLRLLLSSSRVIVVVVVVVVVVARRPRILVVVRVVNRPSIFAVTLMYATVSYTRVLSWKNNLNG